MALIAKKTMKKWIKVFLLTFNAFFWLIGIVLFAIGLYCIKEKTDVEKVAGLLRGPAIFIIFLGAAMFVLSLTGCIGALRENIPLLRFFTLSLLLILVLQFIAAIVGFVFSAKVEEKATDLLKDTIDLYSYDHHFEQFVDLIHTKLECCGVESYTDWKEDAYYQCNDTNPTWVGCGVPHSCCLDQDKVINEMCGDNTQKMSLGDAETVIYTTGCVEAFKDWFGANLLMMAGLAIGLMLPELLGIPMCLFLIREIKLAQLRFQKVKTQRKYQPEEEAPKAESSV